MDHYRVKYHLPDGQFLIIAVLGTQKSKTGGTQHKEEQNKKV
jgi:hypothetical protein